MSRHCKVHTADKRVEKVLKNGWVLRFSYFSVQSCRKTFAPFAKEALLKVLFKVCFYFFATISSKISLLR